jgi:hypothetical protein
LTTAGVAALNTAQVAALETADIAALKTSQIAALTTAGIAAMSTGQIAAIETADIVVLKTAQVVNLTTAQLASLTTDQVAALTTGQVEALTTTQMAAFTTDQVSHLTLGTPIILDLNGDGVQTLSISSGVKFDLFADGREVNTGWVSSGDGLLVMDRNQDGRISDGSELFGSSTTLESGVKASDGYVALRELDSNDDGVISSDDELFADLKVWVDANSDGVSGLGEVKTLAELGITQINAQASVDLSKDNGNLVGLTSTYETADGATHAAADVWFVADKYSQVSTMASVDDAALDSAITALGKATAVVAESSGDDVLSVAEPVPALLPLPTELLVSDAPADLSSRVSSLVQVIGSFGELSADTNALTSSLLDTSGGTASMSSVTSLAVVSMVDVMKQFDANGNLLGSQDATVASAGTSLNVPGIQDPAKSGYLAS